MAHKYPKLGDDCAYLGHFAKDSVLRAGHNTDPWPEDEEPDRNMLDNSDPMRKQDSKIPNVYRGGLQPDFESGESLPEVFDRTKPVKT